MAHGDEFGSGFGVGLDCIESDAAGEFYLCAFVDVGNPFGGLLRCEVIEQQMVCFRAQGFFEFGFCADFDFDWQVVRRAPGVLRFAFVSALLAAEM